MDHNEFTQELQASKRWEEYQEYYQPSNEIPEDGNTIEAIRADFLDLRFEYQLGWLLAFLRESYNYNIYPENRRQGPGYDETWSCWINEFGSSTSKMLASNNSYDEAMQQAILKAFNL